MESKVNYALVGLFVIVLGTAMGAVVLWLTMGTEAKDYDRYRVYTRDSVAGLNLKASVKYRGVDVGQVAAIELVTENPGLIELALDIERGTPVRQDTRAVLTTQGLTGIAYVELTGGSREAPPLEPTAENPMPVILAGPSLITRLDNAFNTMLAQFVKLTNRLDTLLSDQNQVSLNRTLTNIATITGTLAARSDAIRKALDGAAATLEDTAQASAQLTPLLARIEEGVGAVEKMTAAITDTSANLTSTVRETRREIRRLSQNTTPELNALLAQVRQLASTAQRFMQELERNPRMFLLGRPAGQPGPGE